jgi:hypothetical protein
LNIDILTTDGKPGDGRSCPFNFPHPETVGERFGGIWSGMRMLDLRTLIELKLASWMTAPHRPRDMDDVIQALRLGAADFLVKPLKLVEDAVEPNRSNCPGSMASLSPISCWCWC